MKDQIARHLQKVAAGTAVGLMVGSVYPLDMHAQTNEVTTQAIAHSPKVTGVNRLNPTAVEILLMEGRRMTFDFYGEGIVRMFQDNSGRIIRDPESKPEAHILTDTARKAVAQVNVKDEGGHIAVTTTRMELKIDKNTGLFTLRDLRSGRMVAEEVEEPLFEKDKVTLALKAQPGEYFYGGGVQNGRFSHRGKAIAIENQNSWTDGGVASPTPFYWSTAGYGVMWHTFRKGRYDFAATHADKVLLSHHTHYVDVFFMVGEDPVELLQGFYQLTGHPVLLPKFGFYEGHLNAYNRDYWKEDPKGILFEDGKRYKESQKDNGGVKESLNGEKQNYPFSARAVIDRYKAHDMPLGWILPNDGYGAGYGQTETLDGNIANLKSLGDYARKNGVEIGLWTQSDLHPKEGVSALLQRDIVKEVRDAGVRVLKTDVAWVGAGYSFGLNGVADVAHIMPYYGNNARPFIISLDGWAGTQRYAGIWTGDQTGGEWEYIRFHIPTYIGSGLSGQPNITSDVDGIFGGKNMPVNVRDFQWKTFTPMQLNMDGWGSNEKYPQALGEPATSINRWYLKWKSELMPYTYSIAKEAVDGKPMVRAMFLEAPNDYTHGTATRYQFMYGPWFLVAPIYQATRSDKDGNDVRDGIYLPKGRWVDYFTGQRYEGNCVLNDHDAPLWKLPLFVREGAIIPLTNPNNHVNEINRHLRRYELYPAGNTSFTEYDDDGVTESYKAGLGVTTLIQSQADAKGNLHVTVHPAQGNFDGFVKEKATEFIVNVTQRPKKVAAKVGGRKVKLAPVFSEADYRGRTDVYFYEEAPDLNRFATPGSELANLKVTKNPQLRVKLAETDVSENSTQLTVSGFQFEPVDARLTHEGIPAMPKPQVAPEGTGAYSLTPSWEAVPGSDYYEIEFNGMTYTGIRQTKLEFGDLAPETTCTFKVRAVSKDGTSRWAECKATTKSDPLEFAIHGLTATCSAPAQGGFETERLFDFSEAGDTWHTQYGEKAVPFELVTDLHTVNTLDKLHYLPRKDAGNGTLMQGTVAYSMDKKNWTEAGAFDWKRDAETKVFAFKNHPVARYVRLSVTKAVGNYGSGRELYVFKVPGTESYLQGDINLDGKIDHNDLTSYTNYTGLRKGDADFEGYVSNGDINRNGLIDAFDISVVATQLEGGVVAEATDTVGGSLILSASRKTYAAGETVRVQVSGNHLKGVNALSFALSYNPADLEFAGIEKQHLLEMENLTNDRLHTDGSKVLYPTFVNVGNHPVLNGSEDLFILKFKARRAVKFEPHPTHVLLVGKSLDVCNGTETIQKKK